MLLTKRYNVSRPHRKVMSVASRPQLQFRAQWSCFCCK